MYFRTERLNDSGVLVGGGGLLASVPLRAREVLLRSITRSFNSSMSLRSSAYRLLHSSSCDRHQPRHLLVEIERFIDPRFDRF